MIGRVASPVFVGRRDEFAVLQAALERAAAGTGAVVMIGAEAGMGKSRLVAELGELATARGATLVTGECLPLGDGELPYAPIASALRSLLRDADAPVRAGGVHGDELVRLLPELGRDRTPVMAAGGDAVGSLGRLFEQMLAVFAAAAREAPVVLVVEDVHWSDGATRDFLTFLVRGIRRERLALLLTYRIDEVQRQHPARPFLLELERTGHAVRLELNGFGRSDLRDQVTAILDRDPAPALIDSLLERAQGNPFFTEELLATVEQPQAPLPESLREAMLLRVDSRSQRVRTVLQVAAVAGREVQHSLLSAVAEIEADELLDALREAVQSHLLIQAPGSGSYGFRHALLREAVYGDLLVEDRRRLHLRLARALSTILDPADGSEGAAELAHHWHAARQYPEALAASIDAGLRAAEVRAFREAHIQYERVLDLWDQVDPSDPRLSRLEVMQRAADAANLSGDTVRAIALARGRLERISRDDPVAVSLAHERLARYLWGVGRGEEALAEYARAVALMPGAATAERARVLAAEAHGLMLCNFSGRAEPLCDEALRIATDVGAEEIKANVLNTICAIRSNRGEYEEAFASATAALEIARPLRLVEETARAFVNGSDALDQAGRLPEAIAFAREGVEAARADGSDLHADFLRAEVADRLVRTGAWDEAEALLVELVDHAASGVNAGIAFESLAHLQADRGDFDAAFASIERAHDNVLASSGSIFLAPVAAVRATIELWTGDPEAALGTVNASLERSSDSEYVFFTAPLYELGTRALADRSALAPDDRTLGPRSSRQAHELLARLDRAIAALVGRPQPRVLASRAACAAEISRITGPDPAAWAETERLAEAIDDVYRVAYSRWRRAEALIHTGGDHRLAQELARQAHQAAEELGASPLRDAIEALTRAARIELSPQPPDAPAGDPGLERFGLTARELEVLALLGEGLANREIASELVISNKTASVHVSRILAKLSVANRASAAVLAQRLGVIRTPQEPTPPHP